MDTDPTSNDIAHNSLAALIKLRHLRVVAEVANAKSVSAAAKNLNLSIAAVSKTLKEAEAIMGQELFVRAPHAMEITQAGELVVGYARQIFKSIDKISETVSGFTQGVRGEIFMSSRSMSIYPALAKVVASFIERYPRVHVHFMNADTGEQVRLLERGELDLLFSYESPRFRSPKFRVVSFCEAQDLIIVASAGHKVFSQQTVDLKDIAAGTWCIPSQSSRISVWFESVFHARNIPVPTTGVVTSDLTMIVSLLRASDYMAILPESIGHQLISDGIARQIPLQIQIKGDPITMTWNDDIGVKPATQLLIDLFLEHA